MQHYRMTALLLSKRGGITLPSEMRRQLGLSASAHPMLLAKVQDGGIFLQPATAMSVRDISLDQMQQWIADDEEGGAAFWNKAKKAKLL